jgi:uncharacterized protein
MDSHKKILSGIVGSTAYGLAREGSDQDRLGFFVSPMSELTGLYWSEKKNSVVKHEPDVTFHEVGKAIRLMLKTNPTVLEMLWLGEYEDLTEEGALLVRGRRLFLSEKAVRGAYGGYAYEQARRMSAAANRFSERTENPGKLPKHGRHLLRLLRQGTELLTTGELTLKIEDPEEYWAFDNYTPAQMMEIYERENEIFKNAVSILPEKPNEEKISRILLRIRQMNC